MNDAFDLIETIDKCRVALDARPDDIEAAWRLAIAYARAGAPGEARKIADNFAFEERFRSGRGELSVAMWENIGCVGPRLSKQNAMQIVDVNKRREAFHEAADHYATVAARTAGWFPLINAATLLFLAGRKDEARLNAEKTLALLGSVRADYWSGATAAEAYLILGEVAEAKRELGATFEQARAPRYGDVAATLTQLRVVASEINTAADWLDEFAPPPVAHYVGHILGHEESGARIDNRDEGVVAEALEDALIKAGRPGPWGGAPFSSAYGALAAGNDIIVAEKIIAAGTSLHVVLPYDEETFLKTSVAPYGDTWIGRYRRCLDGATSIRIAAEGSSQIDGVLLAFASRLSMGLAQIDARRILTKAVQIALWDKGETVVDYGTAADVATWRKAGGPTFVASPPSRRKSTSSSRHLETERERVPRAILFADVKGFSKLPDRNVPEFTETVFGAFEESLARFRANGVLVETNTWGDAVLAIFNDISAAADCALELFKALHRASNTMGKTDDPLEMRIGGHYGPIFETYNAVLGRRGAVGAHVSTSARVEPKTPVNSAWVTERFAAELELAKPNAYQLEAVGRSELAKGYGAHRVYHLAGKVGDASALSRSLTRAPESRSA